MTNSPTNTTTAVYTVAGMTCSHCVAAVTEEVSQIPGVSEVQVELDGGLLTVTSQGPVERARLEHAVDEAGYELGG